MFEFIYKTQIQLSVSVGNGASHAAAKNVKVCSYNHRNVAASIMDQIIIT